MPSAPPHPRPPPHPPPGCRRLLVGGAVRDKLLGKIAPDRDHVVIGATPEKMLAAGFRPVGADFPVFIHPRTGEEYALARTERKTGRGYRGFVFQADPSVSLEDDLRRRDLTINAIAEDENGELIDPFGGQQDLQNKILRHVSPAFAEDPVRILRVARFAAALPEFAIAAETLALMRQMAENGEADSLTAERVWRELARGLAANRPSRMTQTLADCGALAIVLPEVAALRGIPERLDYHPEGESFVHTQMVVDAAAKRECDIGERFAALLHDIGKAETPPDILPSHYGHEQRGAKLAKNVCARLKTPSDVADLAVLAAGEHGHVHKALEMRPATLADFLARADAFRRPKRFASLLRICEADFYCQPTNAGRPYPQGDYVRAAAKAADAVPAGDIAQQTRQKIIAKAADAGDKTATESATAQKIADAVRAARIKAIAAVRRSLRAPPP